MSQQEHFEELSTNYSPHSLSKDDEFAAAMRILNSVRPSTTAKCLDIICENRPNISEELRCAVDLPSKVLVCEQSGREFLVNNCLSLREGTFYRFISV